MQNKQLRKWLPFLLVTGLLVSGPSLTGPPAFAADPAPQAAQKTNSLAGKVSGKSNKAKTISIEVKGKTEFLKFDDKTTGLEHADEGEAAVIQFEMRGDEKYATTIKPKLASLPEGVKEMKSDEVAKLIAMGPDEGKYVLIDSRPAPRYHEGHLPTAISIPDNVMSETGAAYLPGDAKLKDLQLIFYCGGYT
ncbi:rhodanese-like domain-containing protein [Thiovibrio frasassiensis]|uniref:Rhodanese-like domain-containing protein n=1 Tax=Thiovibrio frasassiensis TaxID=2984131 RepID=A0A9X4RQG7_9BACT|nr:rhodanese-like domain-containing protein [Thiovibrio frasassiensis]MDG4476257.1 rhodanese-like domain-containing protein [Thiovibrio frasassiensis]